MFLIIVAVKCLLYFSFDKYSTNELDWIPFLTTKSQDERTVDEAIFFINKQYNPYLTDQIFQKPIILYFLSYLKSYPFLYRLYYLLIDITIGEIIQTFSGFNQIGYRKAIQIFYHFNPITLLSLLALNTDGIDILSALLSLWILQNFRFSYHAFISSAWFFALSIHLNPNNFLLFSAVLIILKKHSKQINSKFIQYIIVFGIIVIFFTAYLLYIGYFLTGNWVVYKHKCYIDAYFPQNHYPTLSFIWALFSGVKIIIQSYKLFTRYKIFYQALFAFFPLCFIVPFYIIFNKYGDCQKTKSLSFMGLMIGTCQITSLFYYHYVTVFNLFLSFALFFQGSFFIYRIRVSLIILYGVGYISLMGAGLHLTWTSSLTGNPNFLFFQCFVFYLFVVILVTETLKNFIIYSREQQQKQIK